MRGGFFWILVGAAVALYLTEQQWRTVSQPLFPSLQPAGCLPGDPSITYGGKTYCVPQGIIPV